MAMISKKLALGAAALCFAALSSSGASAANLIRNGDFATGTFHDWLVTGNPPADGQNTVVINYTTGDNYPNGAFGEAIPQDPNTSSPFGAYFVTDVPKFVTLSQGYFVGKSGDYDISFDYYAPANGQANPLDAYLKVYNGLSGELTDLDAKATTAGWHTFSVDEYLVHGGHDLKFDFTVPGNFNSDGHQISDQYAADFIVTNVAVGCVPEPATWGMMLIGFFGLGAMLRRRPTAQAAVA